MQPRPFADQGRSTQLLLVIVAPAVLGALAGWLLGVSAAAYWAVQFLAAVGGFLAGTEHRTARGALLRGLAAGVIFGLVILLVRGLTSDSDVVSLGSAPGLLPVVTAVASMLLGLLGQRLGGRLAAPSR